MIVEILSEENTVKDINDKVKDYLSIGLERVVLIDPFTETVTIYHYGRKEAGFYSFDDEFKMVEGIKIRLKEVL